MSIITKLEDAAKLLEEVRGYLIAAADGSMSRNNSEQLASELLAQIDAYAKVMEPEAALSPEGRARTQGYASAVKTEEGK